MTLSGFDSNLFSYLLYDSYSDAIQSRLSNDYPIMIQNTRTSNEIVYSTQSCSRTLSAAPLLDIGLVLE